MLRKMPFILVAMIFAITVIDFPIEVERFFYSISLTIKSFIITLLPIVIFCLLFKAIVNLSSKAGRLITTILILICISNLFSTSLSYFIGTLIYGFNFHIIKPHDLPSIEPLWLFDIPKIADNDKAMFSAIVIGLISSKLFHARAIKVAFIIDKIVHKVLGILIYIIPFFIIGFIMKMKADGVMHLILQDYASIFVIVAASIITYNVVAYFAMSDFKVNAFLRMVSNIMPAAISGFTTMSSAASMPLTIMGVEDNAKHKDIAKSIVPATVNIHLVGDCFAIPIFAYAVLKSYDVVEPSILEYTIFALYFVIAKFSVAAIPGGGILVMLPIIEQRLGFNGEMMSLITALYIMFDPVITFGNILGNGAFAKFIDRMYTKILYFR